MKAAAASTINGAAMDVERAIFVADFSSQLLSSVLGTSTAAVVAKTWFIERSIEWNR